MECKKIKLCEATQDKVYSDEYGFLGAKISYEINAKINIDKRVTQQVYRKVYKKTEGNQYVEIINEDLKNIFDLELFVVSNNYWYGNRRHYIKIKRVINIKLIWDRQTAIAEASDKNALDGILNTEVYETDNYKPEALRWFEIKEGLPVIYQGKTWKVEKLFHAPNPENKLCKIVSWKNDRSAYISCDFRLIDENGKIDPSGDHKDHKFYKLPYYEYPATEYELNLFNDEIRENDLSPYLVYGNDGGALFWQPLEDASRYIVYVYKYRSNESIKKKLYLLEKKIIERNKCWCKVDNIYGVKYILRLEAENRAGDIIGRSRGIAIKFGNVFETEILPGYWNPQTIK